MDYPRIISKLHKEANRLCGAILKKYPRNRETGNPSQEDLLKIMDEVPECTYIAICDYLKEAKEEINTWPYKFEIHDYSVFNMGL